MRSKISKALRFRILARDGFKCRYCGAPAPSARLVIDHFIAVAGGGSNNEENLVTACSECNSGKGDRRLTGLAKPVVGVACRRGKQTAKDPRNRAPGFVRKEEPNHHVLNTGAVIETGDDVGDDWHMANVWCESHQRYEWHKLKSYWIGHVGTWEAVKCFTGAELSQNRVGSAW